VIELIQEPTLVEPSRALKRKHSLARGLAFFLRLIFYYNLVVEEEVRKTSKNLDAKVI